MQLMPMLALLITAPAPAPDAQEPPQIIYTLTIDTTGVGSFTVELRIPRAPDTLTLAAAAHPEYDDKYWRYLDHIQVAKSDGTRARVTRLDSVLWRVSNAGGDLVVSYRIQPPVHAAPRPAWRAFVAKSGALVGGPHSFLYLPGAEGASVVVRLNHPAGWQVFTGLERRGDTYYAPNMAALMDAPIFAGIASNWQFSVNGIPHRVAYWRAPDAVAFDTAAFVSSIERYVRETIRLFGSTPYKDYTFVFQDGAYGGLEHYNSVTLGAPSADLARDPYAYLLETAHEFFHTWNLMQIRPREYRDLDYKVQPPVSGLWFSEGLTLFYADLLARRAGLPVHDSSRVKKLEGLLSRYFSNPGNVRFSAEQVSRVAYNAQPGSLGDFDASTHLQGEVIGNVLDLIIRGATDGRRSMDDVMRLMRDRFSGNRRFLGSDVEQAVSDVCRCSVAAFFEAHIRSGNPIDVNRYLEPIGLRASSTQTLALAADGTPQPDLRIRAWQPSANEKLLLLFWNPESIWVKAGLHTNDRLVSVNSKPVRSWAELRSLVGPLRIGDRVTVVVERPNGQFSTDVTITGYDRTAVSISEIEGAGQRQRALRNQWLAGK